MKEMFDKCKLCPRKCMVNRNKGEIGYCRASNKMKIGGYHLHMWEEPVITGEYGSGTIFFSYCNLGCVYCQNYDISFNSVGEEISIERFKDICLELQNMGAENINLVTPTHYIPLIREGIILAKKEGLTIPIIYNTSSYENVESLKLLDGLIDIYLPDFKYYDNNLGRYSNITNYLEIASKAIEEMYRQAGTLKYEDGILKKGMIIRHLVLPGHIDDSKKIIKYLYDKYGDNVILSIMNQYTPIKKLEFDELNYTVLKEEYNDLIDYASDLGIEHCFIQEETSQSQSFIPKFQGDKLI